MILEEIPVAREIGWGSVEKYAQRYWVGKVLKKRKVLKNVSSSSMVLPLSMRITVGKWSMKQIKIRRGLWLQKVTHSRNMGIN